MPLQPMEHQKRFRRIGAAILAAGLLAAAVVYFVQPPDEENDLMGLGTPSKRDLYQMERLGGKANVVANELTTWFDSRWHGRKLASTLAVLAAAGAGVCFLCARLPHDPFAPDEGSEATPPATGE